MLHFMTYEFKYEFMYVKNIMKSYVNLKSGLWGKKAAPGLDAVLESKVKIVSHGF